MNKNFLNTIFPQKMAILFFLLINHEVFSQDVGKIISTEEAYEKFGVAGSYTVTSKSFLENLLMQSGNLIMFGMAEEGLIILDSNRKLLYPKKAAVNAQDIFTIYSSSVVSDLLNRFEGNTLTIEQRAAVLSITFGYFTLEFGQKCPPYCNSIE